jgi:hypothetical protein
MMRTIVAIMMFAVWSTAGYAQQQSNTDTQQILQLLQGINNKFDVIDKRLDSLEKITQSGANSPAPSTSAATAKLQPDMVAVPGWKIDVLPYDGDTLRPAPIARTKAPIGKTFFNLHFGDGPTAALVAYRGSAYFRARENGQYTFKLTMAPAQRFACSVEFNVEKDKVFGNKDIEGRDGVQDISGVIDLQTGDYMLNFTIGCIKTTLTRYVGGSGTIADIITESYNNTSFGFKVLGPSDPQFRDFNNDELFFVQPKA